MRDVEMLATVPHVAGAGTLREGKRYHIDDAIADRLIAGGYAREAYAEAAVRRAPENAAKRTGGPPQWPLKTPPAEYLSEYGDDAPKAELARTILAAEETSDE